MPLIEKVMKLIKASTSITLSYVGRFELLKLFKGLVATGYGFSYSIYGDQSH